MEQHIIFLQDVSVDKEDNYSFQYLLSTYLIFYLLFYLVTIESKHFNTDSAQAVRIFFYLSLYLPESYLYFLIKLPVTEAVGYYKLNKKSNRPEC